MCTEISRGSYGKALPSFECYSMCATLTNKGCTGSLNAALPRF